MGEKKKKDSDRFRSGNKVIPLRFIPIAPLFTPILTAEPISVSSPPLSLSVLSPFSLLLSSLAIRVTFHSFLSSRLSASPHRHTVYSNSPSTWHVLSERWRESARRNLRNQLKSFLPSGLGSTIYSTAFYSSRETNKCLINKKIVFRSAISQSSLRSWLHINRCKLKCIYWCVLQRNHVYSVYFLSCTNKSPHVTWRKTWNHLSW